MAATKKDKPTDKPKDKPVRVGQQKYPEIVANLPSGLATKQQEEETHILAYWRVIVTRRCTVIAIFATAIALTLIWTLKQTPMYAATMIIEIERETPSVLNFKDFYQADTDYYIDYTLQSYFKILTSRSLARRVVTELREDLNKEFAPAKPSPLAAYLTNLRSMFKFGGEAPAKDQEEEDELRPLIDQYVERVKVNPLRQSWLLKSPLKPGIRS